MGCKLEAIEQLLRDEGFEGIQSCAANSGYEGYVGGCQRFPTVWFEGEGRSGLSAVAIVQSHGYEVRDLHRVWRLDGELIDSVCWQMSFRREQ